MVSSNKDKKSKSIIYNEQATNGVIGYYMSILLISIVSLSVLIPVVSDQVETTEGEYATGTFTFSGNTSVGEYANITIGGTDYCFYFNVTAGKPVGCLVVNVGSGKNTSVLSATELAASINGDTDINGLLTATNTVVNVTRITADDQDATANSYVLSDTGANIASAGMSGGVTGVSATTSTILGLLVLFVALGMLMLYMRPLM